MTISHKNEVVVCYLNPSFVKKRPTQISRIFLIGSVYRNRHLEILRKVAIIKLFKTVSLIETSQLICSANILNLKML